MADDLQILAALNRYGVRFVVIGGHAVNFHGYSRITEDTDVIWARTPDSEQSLFDALREIDAKYIGEEIDPVTKIEHVYPVTLTFVRASPLMMLITKFGFLDLFDYIPGFPQEEVEAIFKSHISDGGIHYASLDWLRRMKQASGRTKDKLDLENLPE
jgi:hypothetical protein